MYHFFSISLYFILYISLYSVFLYILFTFRKSVLRNFVKFTGKHLFQSLFFNKVAGQCLFHLIRSSTKIIEFDHAKFPARISSEDGVWREFLEVNNSNVFKKNECLKHKFSYSFVTQNVILTCLLDNVFTFKDLFSSHFTEPSFFEGTKTEMRLQRSFVLFLLSHFILSILRFE